MSEGMAKVTYLGNDKIVYNTQPNIDFLYEVSTVKNPAYSIGDRVMLQDGREFRYAKSVGACHAAHGCEFTYTGYTSYTAFATNHAVGVHEITIPAATHAALTADELRGGYVIIFDGSDDSNTTVRGIVGNDAAAANAAFNIRIDAAITNAIVSGTEACEVYRNPFAALQDGSLNSYPKAGIPAAYVSASGRYFWVQTKGVTWVAPQSGVGDAQGQKGAFWRHDGSLDKADTALATTVPAGSSSQYAGFTLAGSQSGNGPLFNLVS